jgi:hypothetical protein
MQYVTDMYGIYPAIKPEKNRERESVRKRRGEKRNNTEGNTREKKKSETRSKAEQGEEQKSKGREKKRPNGEVENTDSRRGQHHHRLHLSRTRYVHFPSQSL